LSMSADLGCSKAARPASRSTLARATGRVDKMVLSPRPRSDTTGAVTGASDKRLCAGATCVPAVPRTSAVAIRDISLRMGLHFRDWCRHLGRRSRHHPWHLGNVLLDHHRRIGMGHGFLCFAKTDQIADGPEGFGEAPQGKAQ